MEIPQSFEEFGPKVLQKDVYLLLKKCLYWLKQAPRALFEEFNKFFHELGFRSATSDPKLLVEVGVYALAYINNMLTVGIADATHLKSQIPGCLFYSLGDKVIFKLYNILYHKSFLDVISGNFGYNQVVVG
jgi:hypothetical protein